jgi:hypothetical protein
MYLPVFGSAGAVIAMYVADRGREDVDAGGDEGVDVGGGGEEGLEVSV